MRGFIVLGLLVSLLSGFTGASSRVDEAAGTAPDKWRWEKVDNASLALVGPSGILWRLNYDPALDTP
jgi:hypothetical protein